MHLYGQTCNNLSLSFDMESKHLQQLKKQRNADIANQIRSDYKADPRFQITPFQHKDTSSSIKDSRPIKKQPKQTSQEQKRQTNTTFTFSKPFWEQESPSPFKTDFSKSFMAEKIKDFKSRFNLYKETKDINHVINSYGSTEYSKNLPQYSIRVKDDI